MCVCVCMNHYWFWICIGAIRMDNFGWSKGKRMIYENMCVYSLHICKIPEIFMKYDRLCELSERCSWSVVLNEDEFCGRCYCL